MNRLYFYTVVVKMQALGRRAWVIKLVPAAYKLLNALSVLAFRRIMLGFPLPTPVLTPGWAIF